jgi:Mannosyltransferase putative
MVDGLSKAEHAQLSALGEALRREPVQLPPADMAGRGIVICAGGARIFTNAYVLIRTLRDVIGCTLPIEVWHFGGAEISPAMAAILRPLGVTLVDAVPVLEAKGVRIGDGWQLKPFALMWSRFAEALLLDADQVPVTDPAALFDWPEYREAGAVYWPDVVAIRTDNPIWQVLRLDPRPGPSFESGQILLNKARHWMPLVTTLRLNEAADLLYRLIYGDKDSFLLAWALHDAAHAVVPYRPYVDDHLFVQRDFAGRPLFQHRTHAKWTYAGEQLKFPGFVHEAACLGFLDELRRIWGGRVFTAPDRTVAARQAELDLIGQSPLTMRIGDDAQVELELWPYGELGRGRNYDRQNWWVEELDGHLHLVMCDGDSRTYQLRREDSRIWVGTRLFPVATKAVLKPASAVTGLAPGHSAVAETLVDELLTASGIARVDADAAPLIEALALLARVVPGAPETVRRRAEEAHDSKLAARLAAIADALQRRRRPPARPPRSGALATGYVRE